MNMEGRGGGDQLVLVEEEEGSGISSCPSFNCYSSRCPLPLQGANRAKASDGEDHDDDFQFVLPIGDHASCVIDSDRIGPVFPVFNRDLLVENGAGGGGESRSHSIMISLRDLFAEEGNRRSSSSEEADEDDDLEGIPEGTYCVWTPRGTGGQTGDCRKSSSTGSRSSRRWRFLDLVRRINSERKASESGMEEMHMYTRKKVVVG